MLVNNYLLRFGWDFDDLVVSRYLEVVQWVPHSQKAEFLKAVWERLGDELSDLRAAGSEEWAEEGAGHLYTALELLLTSLLLGAQPGERDRVREP